MPRYLGEAASRYLHDESPAVGVLLANLGSPQAPTARALRSYLREFLWDPRVIEAPRATWWLILNLFILPVRPRRSAALYRNIWTEEGPPLIATTRRQAEALAGVLGERIGTPLHFAVGMRYGRPSIAEALRALRRQGCRRLLVLPLYPQYFAGTTGSTFDAVFRELVAWRWVPEVRTLNHYHDAPGYIEALAGRIRELWETDGEPERLLFSYHGIPQRYFEAGDPYFCHCQKTTRLVAERLGLEPERHLTVFQSRFGREEWLKPYADRTLEAMAHAGIKSVDVVCPGFAADCLETLDEMGRENRELFLSNGGERYRFIPCLNDRPDHIRLLADLVAEQLTGWVLPPEEWRPDAVAERAAASRARAEAMATAPAAEDGGFGAASRAL